MRLALSYLLIVSGALAQPAPPNPTLNDAIQGFWTANNSGQISEAVVKRAQAQSLIEQMPPTAEGFAGQVNNVAQLFQAGGMTTQARDMVLRALSRAGGSDRTILLNTLASYWEQDGNLLRAATALEQAVAFSEAAATAPSGQAPNHLGGVAAPGASRAVTGFRYSPTVGAPFPNSFLYSHLVNTYQQLGRREAIAGLAAKMLAQPNPDYRTIADIYKIEGRTDDVAAMYLKMADVAFAKPQHSAWEVSSPLQMLANLYAEEGRSADAAAAIQQAIAAFEDSSQPQDRNGSVQLREMLARYLQQAGKPEDGDKIYRELLDQAVNPQTQLNVVNSYAQYLLTSDRGPEAEQYLNSYLSTHQDLDSQQQGMLLFTMAQAARQSRQPAKAEEYQRAAMARSRNQNVTPPVADALQMAQSAAMNGQLDDAFRLATQAIDQAANLQALFQMTGQVPSIASMLAARKEPALADRLYQKLFIAAESWQAATIQPLLNVAQSYPRFLMQQKERWNEVPYAVERYQTVLTAAHGPETGLRQELLQFKIDFARARGATAEALATAKEMLELEESLNGSTGIAYLRALQTAAGVHQWAGDTLVALELYQQAVKVSDIAFPIASWERGSTRMNAALAFARQRQFDEAERLANEAVAIAKTMRPPQGNQFTAQLEQIRRMKADPSSIDSAAQTQIASRITGAAQTGPFVPGVIVPGTAGSVIVGVLGADPIAAPPPPPVKKQ